MSVLDRFRLDDKVAIVTGASSGLGVAFAKALAEAGADVALGARRVEKLEETKQLVEAGRPQGDRRRHRRLEARGLPGARRRRDGGSSGASTCSSTTPASAPPYPATRETPDEFRKVIDINLNGCYWMAQACGRVMEPGSSIVNISSVLGLTTAGLPQAAYSASKAALIGLTRDLAQQWTGRKGIRVNALAPGFFESEMTDQYPDGYLEGMQERRLLVQRKGDPEELAAALIFLASDAGGYVTGITLPVDGGMSST